MKTLGMHIRQLREAKDLSLREFARELDVSAAFVSDIELGRRFPSDMVLRKIARILDAPIEDLRALDTRAPVEDLKRLISDNPEYGLAFRRVIDKKFSPKDLIEFAENKRKKPRRKK